MDDTYTIAAGETLFAGEPADAPPPAGLPLQYVLTDAGEGPNRNMSCQHLIISWRNVMGDWIDALGVAQGTTPYNTPTELPLGLNDITVTALVQKWQLAGEAKGFMCRGGNLTWDGRLGTIPPVLIVEYADRTDILPVLSSACWSSASTSGIDSRIATNTSSTRLAGISIDGRLLQPGILSAKLRLNITARSGNRNIAIHEANPPRYDLVQPGDPGITYGVALVPNHPAILAKPSFATLVATPGGWSDVRITPGAEVVYDDPKFPGEPVYRALFRGTTTQDYRSSTGLWCEFMRGDTTLQGYPNKMPHNSDVMHCRLYFLLEDDWRTSFDGNKMAIGWDLRMGYWNTAYPGKWQSTTGNGGAPGSGLKRFPPQYAPPHLIEYQGHSLRMEAGKGPADPMDPYEQFRPIETYVYHLDQDGYFGDKFRHGTNDGDGWAVFQRNRWHCIEQRIKLNSVVGPYDELGNGEAVRDGELITWVDGKLVHSITNFAWRRHLEMGIQGPWVNWFFGGTKSSPIDMHYRMAELIVAKEYIGPRAP